MVGQSKLAWLIVEFERAVEQLRSYENSDEGWSNFIEARKKVLDTDRLWHVAYSEWVFNKVDKRAGEIEEIRANRLSAIKAKLSQIGWDDTLAAMISSEHSQLMSHPLVKQPRPLTDRAWTKIEADVVSLMRVFKANRMARAHAQIISGRRKLLAQAVTNWKNTQPVSAVVPSPADLLQMEEMQPLNARIENDPDNVEFTLETFAEFSTQLPDLCAKWISKATDILLEICKATLCLRPVTRDTLNLVTSVFICAECGGVVSYPAVLTHFCFTKPHAQFYDPEDIYDLILEGDSYNTPWMKVAPQSLLWLGHLSNSLAPLIRSCGFDPQTTTHDQLDEENVIIRFTDIYGGSDIMDWRCAVRTVAEHGLHDGEWTRETDQEVLDAIPQLELDFYRFECAVVVCVHCRDSLIALALPAHMRRHKEDQPISRSDFWVHPDNPLEALFRIPREDALSDSDDDDLLIYPASSEYE
ncbi:hypothetical protein ONZ45_g11487 [Pleurotus djamor]|nr:hypothetical protein ONZ45_g11487 [Pleurotus djamor]